MAKFGSGPRDHAGFLAIQDQLIEKLARAFESQLVMMGQDAKGISWFSSVAQQYVATKRAA
ncbi:hypothetical protein ABFU18_16400 [Xanthomonas campestris pv. campestris]|uniref:hypothetical protein n=1 Tax=Xanthomonas TaxID=338 RepID=UPI001611D703|nr:MULTISPECIES: hypothetical protein [Xanthomonas]MBB6259313.1 hypothetical protein [Xanthomonas arboricola]